MKVIKLHFDSAVSGEEKIPGLAETIRMPARMQSKVRPAGPAAPETPGPKKAGNDEATARAYLDAMLTERKGELLPLTAPESPELVPDLKMTEVQDSPLTPTRVVKFIQTSKSLPVFGSAAYVELDGESRKLVSTDATLTDTPDVSAVAKLATGQALEAIAAAGGATLTANQVEQLAAPELNFFADKKADKWRLVYYFRNVPVVPAEQKEAHAGHGLGRSPREDFRQYDYLVDAHTGEIAYYFSSQPCLDVPVKCRGKDELGAVQEFYGMQATGGQFRLSDPLRNIETYDHAGGDIQAPVLPTVPISHTATDFAATQTAGVSAHYFATLVYDFYNHVLKRDGVDDKGMKLISMVNATYAADEAPPNWHNAVWWNKRMWYGRVQNGAGGFNSYARYFDVIAHELTHGVTETTSNLVYRDLPGALNESFSDIFGVIIANWYPGEPNAVSGWNWEIGAGLGTGGKPLRDLRDPASAGQPDHMDQYKPMTGDNGGVHKYSGIHNKAAYHVLTAVDAAGKEVFTAQDVALLYYLTLTRLTRLSEFSDTLRVLKSVISTLYAGDTAEVLAKHQAVTDAYAKAGIV